MRKTLISLVLGLSSCTLQPPKCPDEDQLLRAGFRIYSASKIIESKTEAHHKLAKAMYGTACEYYFNCNSEHIEKHYLEAEEKAAKYLSLNNEDKEKFYGNIKKIKEESQISSLTSLVK